MSMFKCSIHRDPSPTLVSHRISLATGFDCALLDILRDVCSWRANVDLLSFSHVLDTIEHEDLDRLIVSCANDTIEPEDGTKMPASDYGCLSEDSLQRRPLDAYSTTGPARIKNASSNLDASFCNFVL